MTARGMTENYIVAAGNAHMARRNARYAEIVSAQAAAARQAQVREICSAQLGPFPETSPLNLKSIDTHVREGYTIELLTYESVPGVITTANLYVPDGGDAPYPGVLCIPAHYPQGKVHSECQRLGQLLARRGIATLIVDAPGQGERLEFYDSTMRRSFTGRLVAAEQAHLGNIFLLSGENLAKYIAWDAIRGLDLLAERADVDPARLGAIGCGGGAPTVRLLCCLEPRVRAAAIVADHYEAEYLEGGDEDHVHFSALAYGVAALDLLLPFAPRPLLTAHCTQDKFKGDVHKHAGELARFYDLLNGRENMVPFEADGPLGYLKPTRSRAAEHFARAFHLPDSRAKEPESPPEPAELLYCTETGQVANSLNSVSLFAHQKDLAGDLPPTQAVPRDANAADKLQGEFRDRFRPFLRLPERQAAIQAEIESRSNDWGYAVEKGRLMIDEGLYSPYSFYALTENFDAPGSQKSAPVVLVLHERGIAGVSSHGGWMQGFNNAGFHVMAIDVCGIGETRLQPKSEAQDAYETLLCGPESQWVRRALNTGLSMFGLRTFNVLRALEYLRGRFDVNKDAVSVIGVGRGGLWGLYAAALDNCVSHCVLLRALDSYKSLTLRRRHNHHFSLYLPGCLKEFDLPQVAACLAPRALTIVNPVNSRKERLQAADVQREYALTGEIFKLRGAAQRFRVINTDSAPETFAAIRAGL